MLNSIPQYIVADYTNLFVNKTTADKVENLEDSIASLSSETKNLEEFLIRQKEEILDQVKGQIETTTSQPSRVVK